jgi:hypothetical protein
MLEIDCGGVDSVRSDGGLVQIRTIAETDLDSLRALHARASDRSIYLRFFSLSRETADDYVAKRIPAESILKIGFRKRLKAPDSGAFSAETTHTS